MTANQRTIKNALLEVGANQFQCVAAFYLLNTNGLDNALEYVYGSQARGLTANPAPGVQLRLELDKIQ